MTTRRRKVFSWVAATLVVLVLLSVLFVRPLAERALSGLGGLVGVTLNTIAHNANVAYETARQRVENHADAKALLGEPLKVAPIEQVQWLTSDHPDSFTFEFQVTGPHGEAKAHVVAKYGQGQIVSTLITLTTPDGMAHELSDP